MLKAMFISSDRLQLLAEDYCCLDGEISYLIRLLREIRFFRASVGRSPVGIFCRVLEAIACLRLLSIKN